MTRIDFSNFAIPDPTYVSDTTGNGTADWGVVKEGPLNVQWAEYGAKCDGSTDDTNALRLAIQALPAGGGQMLVPGISNFSGQLNLDSSNSVQILGLGGGSAGVVKSALRYTGTDTANAISARSSSGFGARDCAILANGVGYTGSLIDLSATGTLGATTSRGRDTSLWGFERCLIQAPTTASQLVLMDRTIDGAFTRCNLVGAGRTALGRASTGNYSNGVVFDKCRFGGALTPYLRDIGNGWTLLGNVYENLSGGGAGVLAFDTGYSTSGLSVLGGWHGDSGASGTWYDLSTTASSVTFLGGYMGSGSVGIAARAAITGLTALGVKFDQIATAINVTAQGSNWLIKTNDMSSCTAGIAWAASTFPTGSSIIEDNKAGTIWAPGMVPVVAGAVSDASFPATPPNGTIAIDSLDGRIYARYGGGWHFAALT